MKFIDFIKDKLGLLIFNFSFLIFTILVISFSPLNIFLFDTIFYIITVNLIILGFYLTISYINKNKFLQLLSEGVEDVNSFNHISLLKLSNEEKECIKLIKNHQRLCDNRINTNSNIFKDNTEMLILWVHDIKMPISIIKLIIERNENLNYENPLDKIDNQLMRIENSVERVLYLSKLDDFHKDFLIHEVDLEKVIQEIIRKYSKYFIANKLKLVLENLRYNVLSDKKWLSFIFDQIIANSLKYTKSGDSISIIGEKKDNILKIIIRDNGCGIKREDLSRIFDKGFTGNNGRNNAKSTGLGLYLSKKLCEKLNHGIYVDSVYNEYTQFIITF